MLPWQPFVINVLKNEKAKKLAYLAGYQLDLAQIWYKGVVLNSKSKTSNKNLI